jgi:tripartite-type tricarboxylate transporter receptor subunit TctC
MVHAALHTPAWKQTADKLGWSTVFLGGDEYRKFLEEDTQRVGAILESLGLKK